MIVNPPALSGMSTSVANMGGFPAGALLQPAVGWIMDRRRDGALMAWRIRETHCRNIWKETT